MSPSLRALLSGIIDYAGLFPPAKLPLDQAIRNYARYRTEPDSYEQGYAQGYYVVRGVDPAWRGSVNLALPGSYRDTKLSVNVRSIGDRAGAVYLECRRGPDSGYGAVVFLDRGAYFIGRVENEGASPLSLPGSSPYNRLRRTGMTLSLTCVGDRMALSLDGIEIAAARRPPFRC